MIDDSNRFENFNLCFPMRFSLFLLAGIFALLPISTHAAVTTLAADHFDGAPYSDNAALVIGWGQLPHGRWALQMKGVSSAITSTTKARSGTRSLQLSTGTKAEGQTDNNQAQVIFSLTPDGQDHSPTFTTTEALQIRFSIYFEDQPFTTHAYVQGDKQAALITLGNNINVFFEGGSSTRLHTGLQANTWYTLQIDLPNLSNGSNQYTVSLFDADNSLLNSSSGTLVNPVAYYRFFTLFHSNTENKTLYIDDVLAVTAVPEGSSLAYIAVIVGMGLLRRFSLR